MIWSAWEWIRRMLFLLASMQDEGLLLTECSPSSFLGPHCKGAQIISQLLSKKSGAVKRHLSLLFPQKDSICKSEQIGTEHWLKLLVFIIYLCSVGCRVWGDSSRKQDECKDLSDVNTPLLLWQTRSSGAILKPAVGAFCFYTQQWARGKKIGQMLMKAGEHTTPAGRRSTLAPLLNSLVFSFVGQDMQLCVCFGPVWRVQDVPVMVVCLPVKTLTLADHPDPPLTNKTRTTFDQSNRKPPTMFRWWDSLSVLALSSIQALVDGS